MDDFDLGEAEIQELIERDDYQAYLTERSMLDRKALERERLLGEGPWSPEADEPDED